MGGQDATSKPQATVRPTFWELVPEENRTSVVVMVGGISKSSMACCEYPLDESASIATVWPSPFNPWLLIALASYAALATHLGPLSSRQDET